MVHSLHLIELLVVVVVGQSKEVFEARQQRDLLALQPLTRPSMPKYTWSENAVFSGSRGQPGAYSPFRAAHFR